MQKKPVVHFRPASQNKTMFQFTCGNNNLNVADRYTYLGLVFTEHLDYQIMANTVANSASRALGLIIAKFKNAGGMPFSVYTKLYDTLVMSVINYGSMIWGVREYSCINSIHNRACRFFLGVGRYTPNAAIQGDMGWKMMYHRIWINTIRHWCKMCNLDNRRISKKVFLWSYEAGSNKKNWSNFVMKMFQEIGLTDIGNVELKHIGVVLTEADSALNSYFVQKWSSAINREYAIRGEGRNKLRTYRMFKQTFNTEDYVKCVMPRNHRSALAKFRCGVAPLRIETGRYERNRPSVNEITCPLCNNGVEDECHVIMKCPAYSDLRNELFDNAIISDHNFNTQTDENKFIYLLSQPNMTRQIARILFAILQRRQLSISI